MANSLIPLSALSRQPLQTWPQIQQQQFTLQNLRRQGIAQDLQIEAAKQQQKDAQTIREVFSRGLPHDQIGDALRQAGQPGAGAEWDKLQSEQLKAFADMSKEHREQSSYEAGLQAQKFDALLNAPPEMRQQLGAQSGMGPVPVDDDTLRFLRDHYLETQKKANLINAETGAANASKPTAIGGGFTGEGNHRMQGYVQKNPATGAFEIKAQDLGAIEPPKSSTSTSFEEKTYEDFLKDPELMKKYAPSRVGFERWKSDQIKARSAATQEAGRLSPEAITLAARRYLQDGTMPAFGMGAAAVADRAAVLNQAALMDPAAFVAANAAEFKKNQAVLTQLGKNAAAVNAFESTAKKNLQQFIDSARKVRDLGSPMLNRALRSIDRNVLGKTEQTAYDTARQVALTEIARVVNNPNLVGILSDSARSEMQTALNPDATLAQTLRASEVLLQDMANRKGGIDDQIKEVQQALHNPAGGPADQSPVEELEFGPDGKLRKKQ